MDSGPILQTFSPMGRPDDARFALWFAEKCIRFYENYFDSKFPLPKFDLLNIPDVNIGAMDNWGCATFPEHSLLVDPRRGTHWHRWYVAMVVAHEVAHQWLGNLAGLASWNELSLIEALATWGA